MSTERCSSDQPPSTVRSIRLWNCHPIKSSPETKFGVTGQPCRLAPQELWSGREYFSEKNKSPAIPSLAIPQNDMYGTHLLCGFHRAQLLRGENSKKKKAAKGKERENPARGLLHCDASKNENMTTLRYIAGTLRDYCCTTTAMSPTTRSRRDLPLLLCRQDPPHHHSSSQWPYIPAVR